MDSAQEKNWSSIENFNNLFTDRTADESLYHHSPTLSCSVKTCDNREPKQQAKTTTANEFGDQKNSGNSIKTIWQNFATSTTLHGVVYIQSQNINVVGRIFWCLLFSGMVGCFGYVLIDLLLTYREYPFTSVWNLRRVAMIDSPTVTLCPLNFFDLRKIRKASGFQKRVVDNFVLFSNNTFEKFDDSIHNVTYTDLVDSYGFSREDMILRVSVGDGFQRKLMSIDELVTRRVFKDRLCFTVNDFRDKYQFDSVTSDQSVEMYIDLRKNNLIESVQHLGLYLHIHKKGKSMSRSTPILISPGFTTFVLFKQIDYTFLPLPYKSFENLGCVDLNDANFKNPLMKYPLYTRDNCLMEFMETFSADRCGCVERSYVEEFKVRECSVIDSLYCVWALPPQLESNFTLINLIETVCPNACNDTVIEYSSSAMVYNPYIRINTTNKEESIVHLVLQAKTTNIETVKHVPELTLIGILATVGGYLGLFLGASLMSAAEIAQVLIASIKYYLPIGWLQKTKT